MEQVEFEIELRMSEFDGKFLVIRDEDKRWWTERARNGFFSFLEEEDQPIKVIHDGRTFYFNVGINRKTLVELMRELGVK